jgi:hypothetical protein
MRRPEDHSLDPEVLASLDAIDATLAGDPVDPRHAELAELALLLRAERPQPSDEYTRSLDARVERRFVANRAAQAPHRRARRRWAFVPGLGLAAAAVVAVVVAASSGGVGGVGHQVSKSPSAGPAARAAASGSVPGPAPGALSPATPFPGLTLPPGNHKIVQSSELYLAASPNRIDDVAQEVFDVVGTQNGFVSSSSVTANGNPSGYAQFRLSVPSATLPQTMTELSELRYAHVTSRTDNTNDITGQFNSANAALSQAQALRTSLLKQLQNATTQTQVSSLQAQLSDANAKIAAAQATLRSLNHQVNYSQISLTVQASSVAPVTHSGSGGFTIGRAAHDAGRVLTVVAGVALIALAVLVPLALVGAVGWWVASRLRRRRRERALGLA